MDMMWYNALEKQRGANRKPLDRRSCPPKIGLESEREQEPESQRARERGGPTETVVPPKNQ
jgi:hypothetical protein